MKKTLAIILCMALILPFSHGWAAQDDGRGIRIKNKKDLRHGSGKIGAYTALVIGINDYEDARIPDLNTAVKDAREMAKLLEQKYGFTTRLLLDREADKEGIYKAMRELSVSAKPQDSLLIYYAGHGDLDRDYNDGWWIPADARAGNPVTYLDNTQVQKAMRATKARHALLISDSCYSGTLFGQGRDMPPVIDDRYYLNLYNETSRWGMTSGNKTPVSDTGTDGHSVFAYQLLKELQKNEKPYLSTQELYTRIAPIIANNSEQIPMCRPIKMTGDQGGEFVFILADSKKSETTIPDKKFLINSLGMKFVYIPPGEFMMGSPENEQGRYDWETQHRVRLTRGFYMQTTETTQGQWKAVIGNNPSHFKDCGNNCPVEQVSWNNVQEFIKKLNRREGKTYRLPTEAEWEYAARAGTQTAFAFGRCLSTDQANYDGNYPIEGCSKGEYRKKTISVSSFQPNAWGLYDMHGNVDEWCQDWYGSYPSNSVIDPVGPSPSKYRAFRGGSWYRYANGCRSALRGGVDPDGKGGLGFRLVLVHSGQ